jgi:hypothetical protein
VRWRFLFLLSSYWAVTIQNLFILLSSNTVTSSDDFSVSRFKILVVAFSKTPRIMKVISEPAWQSVRNISFRRYLRKQFLKSEMAYKKLPPVFWSRLQDQFLFLILIINFTGVWIKFECHSSTTIQKKIWNPQRNYKVLIEYITPLK